MQPATASRPTPKVTTRTPSLATVQAPVASEIDRVMVVASGHGWSTLDAYYGLIAGFQEAGVETYHYDLHKRIDIAAEWLDWVKEHYAPDADPGAGDVLYQAGKAVVVKSLEVGADAVVVVCGLLFDQRLYVLLRRAGIPVFLFGTESPYDDELMEAVAPLATAVSTNERTSLPALEAYLQEIGSPARATYMPLGFNPKIHMPGFGRDAHGLPEHDVIFVGNCYPSREQLLTAIDWDGIDLALYGVFDTVSPTAPLRQHVRGGIIPNVTTTALYSRAKIVLNLFRSEQFGANWEVLNTDRQGESISPRVIEAAAVGAFMITEWRPEVEELFGDLMPTFRTAEEAERLIRYYLEHEDERAEMAARLPAVVAGYSYTDRARTIMNMLS